MNLKCIPIRFREILQWKTPEADEDPNECLNENLKIFSSSGRAGI
jgi:hypothetical protein